MGEDRTVVSRRGLIKGAAGTLGLTAVGGTAWAATRTEPKRQLIGGGMSLPDGTVVPVDYKSRAAWGANEDWMDWPAGPEEWWIVPGGPNAYQQIKYVRRPVQAITIHYQGEDLNSADPAATVRAIYNYQANTEGWDDIGYNLLIDPNGVVYEGRHNVAEDWPIFGPASDESVLMTTGAHVGGYNTGNIGICLLGDFRHSGGVPTTQCRNALIAVLVGLCRLVKLDPLATVHYYNPVPAADPNDTNKPKVPEEHAARTVPAISGHKDWAATSCPGNAFYPLLGQLRAEVAAALPPPTPAAPRSRPAPTSSPTPGQPGDESRPQPSGPPPSPGPVGRTR